MQRIALSLLLLTFMVPLITCDNYCGKAVKLRPGFVTKYDYIVNFRQLEESTELLQNVTGDMLFRNNAETGIPEVVFTNGKINCNDATPDCLENLEGVVRYQRFGINCPTTNEIEFGHIPDKGDVYEFNTPVDFMTLKWIIALIDTEVTTGLQSNAQTLTKKINLRIGGQTLIVGSVDFSFIYDNPEGYEVKATSADFATVGGFFKNAPVEMSLWSIVDRDDLTVKQQGGSLKIGMKNITMDVSSRFVDYFPEAEYKRAFEDRSMPSKVNETACPEVVQFIQPKPGFDARWKLVVDRFSYKVDNQTLVNKPIVADVIMRSIDDPRFVLAKFIMSPDNSAGHGPSNFSDIGILSFSGHRTLIFDILGDTKLLYVYPKDMLSYFSTSEIFHEKLVKFVSDAAIKDDFAPRVEGLTMRQRCPGVDCDIVYEFGGNEDLLRIHALVLKKECSQKHASYELDMVQIFGRSDQKLKNLSLQMKLVAYGKELQLKADLIFIGDEPKSGNDDLFTVYGEAVDQKWFD